LRALGKYNWIVTDFLLNLATTRKMKNNKTTGSNVGFAQFNKICSPCLVNTPPIWKEMKSTHRYNLNGNREEKPNEEVGGRGGERDQAAAPNEGGGNSSGLGEFWNMELAKNDGLVTPSSKACFTLAPCIMRACAAPTPPWWFFLPTLKFKNALSCSVGSAGAVSSSDDMANTPSLDMRICLRMGVVGEWGSLAYQPDDEESGAVRGPLPNTSTNWIFGVDGSEEVVAASLRELSRVANDKDGRGMSPSWSTSSESESAVSSQMGNSSHIAVVVLLNLGRTGMLDRMGSDRERCMLGRAPRWAATLLLTLPGMGTGADGGGGRATAGVGV
jgi:hypothetical protein